MDWRCGLSDRVPALQKWSPKFKAQSHQKKKKNLHSHEVSRIPTFAVF
jgi:hypothetical protein